MSWFLTYTCTGTSPMSVGMRCVSRAMGPSPSASSAAQGWPLSTGIPGLLQDNAVTISCLISKGNFTALRGVTLLLSFQPVQALLQLDLLALHARSCLWSPKDNHLAQDLGLMDACSFYAFYNWWCLCFLLIVISFLLWCLSYIWKHAFMVSWGGRESVQFYF